MHDVVHRHIVARFEPAVTVAVEHHLARNIRIVGTCGVEQAAVEKKRRTRFDPERQRACGIGNPSGGEVQPVLQMGTGHHIEIAPPLVRRIDQKVAHFERNARSATAFQVGIQTTTVLMPPSYCQAGRKIW